MCESHYKTLALRHDMMEYQSYEDSSFPVEIYDDRFSELYGLKLPCHWHDVIELDLLIHGFARYRIDGEEVPLHEGELLMISPGKMHLAEAYDPSTLVIGLTFTPELLFGQESSLLHRKYILPLIKAHKYLRIKDEICGLNMNRIYYGDRSSPMFELELLDRLLEIMIQILKSPAAAAKTLAIGHSDQQSCEMKKILTYVREHFDENIRITDFCRAANVSRSEVFRLFEKYSLFSPMEYLNSYRMGRAAGYLSETDKSVTEISGMCGFNTPGYFTLQFKKHYGMTPLLYRKKHRG